MLLLSCPTCSIKCHNRNLSLLSRYSGGSLCWDVGLIMCQFYSKTVIVIPVSAVRPSLVIDNVRGRYQSCYCSKISQTEMVSYLSLKLSVTEDGLTLFLLFFSISVYYVQYYDNINYHLILKNTLKIGKNMIFKQRCELKQAH